MTNLILNALDAMPSGGELRLRSALMPDAETPFGKGAALIEVTDTGIGMSTVVQQRIFDPFYSTKGAGGTGMGLAVSYGIVQRHQGSIAVTSGPGVGSTFQVLLPLRRLPEEQPGPDTPRPPEAAPALRILVVEDDEAVRHVLVQMLRRLGHEVTDVDSGRRALDKLALRSYDLLCSDLGMPNMSGWDLIAQAHIHYPELMTMLVTGWGEQIDLVEAGGRGVDEVLAKPFDTARLRQALSSFQLRLQRGVQPQRSR